MPALAAQHIRKAYGSQVILEDATLSLARGEKVALIGANGAGKSTLAKILAGVESPDGGSLSVRRGLSVRYLAQEPELDPSASARAVVTDALTAWTAAATRHAVVTAQLEKPASPGEHERLIEEQAELDGSIVRLGGWERGHEALGFLDMLGVRDVDRPCGPRSGGERRRIALAQLLVASPDIAVLDEPTNHLDADTAAWLEGFLAREFRGALVLVTHDRYFLDAIAQRIVELERGRLTSFAGGYGDYLERKAVLVAHEDRVEQNRQNVLRREREWLSRGPKARATKQKARIQRAVALEGRGPATAGRPDEASFVVAAPAQVGKTILEFRGVQVAAAGGAPPLNAPFDLILTAGERIGVVGPNGIGKTTLMRAILAAVEETRRGERPRDAPDGTSPARAGGWSRPELVSGAIVVGKNTRVAYLDQARAKLDDDRSIFDDVRGENGSTVVHLGVRGREVMELRSYLELFLFDGHKQRQKVGSLSGGERARVALAKVLREGANLILLDEPTNDLDLPTLAALEDLLEGYGGSVLVVTHDRAFLDRIATAILAYEVGGDGPATVTRYAGGYSDYVTQRGDRRRHLPGFAGARTPASAPSNPVAKSADRLTYAERLELEGIVDAVEAADKTVAELEGLLADPSFYATRGQEVAALNARLETARVRAGILVARWEALERRRA
jgi:ATP-binding cassette subfamily F protein uup